MSVGQKLAMLKIRSTSITFLSLRNLKAAPSDVFNTRTKGVGILFDL